MVQLSTPLKKALKKYDKVLIKDNFYYDHLIHYLISFHESSYIYLFLKMLKKFLLIF